MDSRVIRMDGREVFKHAVTNLASVVIEALEANGLGTQILTGWCRIRLTNG